MILDIGANRGDYAALVRAALPEARIYAFEPHPGNFAKLADLASALEFEAIASACGAEPGTLTLYDYPGGEGSSHASGFRAVIEEHHVAQSQGRSEAIEVPVTTVDRFLQERAIPQVDLMKIDVEGLEMSVLDGAKDALDAGRIGMVQFEFSELNVHSRTFFSDFKKTLQEFDLYRILGNGALLPLACQPAMLLELFHYQNVIAKRRGCGRRPANGNGMPGAGRRAGEPAGSALTEIVLDHAPAEDEDDLAENPGQYVLGRSL